jgi:hypothetical protein
MDKTYFFNKEEVKEVAESLGIDWSEFDLNQFYDGMHVELEHGTQNPETNVTDNDIVITAKITLAHLNEFPDYYIRLEKMEEEAEAYWNNK